MALTFPGWNSIEAAARYHRGFEIAGFVALALLLLFEVLAYAYGNRKDAIAIEVEQAATSERSRQEQEASQQRNDELGAARRRAEEAEKASKRTTEELAHSNERITELAKANADRVVTQEQQTRMAAVLAVSPKYKIRIVCNWGDQEAVKFSQPFVDVFRKSGWDLEGSPI
jgi:septal ring factor EnvC (AmiA/AmiB activator)